MKWLLVALSIALMPLASVPVLAQTASVSTSPDQCSAAHHQYQTMCPPPEEPPPEDAGTAPPAEDPGTAPPAPGEPSPGVPPPAITVREAGGAALKDSLTAIGALNASRNDGARELEEDGVLTAENPSIAHPTAASKIVGHPAEVQAVGLIEKEAALQEELGPVTTNHDAGAAPREGSLAPGSNDDPAAIIAEGEAIDSNDSKGVSWPAEAPAGPQAVAARFAKPAQLLPMDLTSPLLAGALVVAAGLLVRRSRR